eukprot:scaffold28790_cov28-Prasinocladus_malaysianus.AAC.1
MLQIEKSDSVDSFNCACGRVFCIRREGGVPPYSGGQQGQGGRGGPAGGGPADDPQPPPRGADEPDQGQPRGQGQGGAGRARGGPQGPREVLAAPIANAQDEGAQAVGAQGLGRAGQVLHGASDQEALKVASMP